MDPLRDPKPAAAAPPQPAAEPAPAPATEEKKEARARRVPAGVVVCPNCGWEEDAHAKFCTMCHRTFNKTDKIDVRKLRLPGFENPLDNPLMDDAAHAGHGHHAARSLSEIPAWILISIGAAALLLPVVVLLFSR
jgi:hypothetical protein